MKEDQEHTNIKNHDLDNNSKPNKLSRNKKRKILPFFISSILVIVFSVTSSITLAAYIQSIENSYKYNSLTKTISDSLGGGKGTFGEPFLIKTPAHLKALSHLNTLDIFDRKTHFRLENDIYWDISKDGALNPIGNNDYPFKSTFNGNGHKINSLLIYGDNTADIGLFGYCSPSSEVKNILLEYPRLVVKENTLPSPNTGKDRVNANPLDNLYGSVARGLPNITNTRTLKSVYNWETDKFNYISNLKPNEWLKYEYGKIDNKYESFRCYIKLQKYAYYNGKATLINWSSSDDKLCRIIYDNERNPYIETYPSTEVQNPSNVKRCFFVSGYIQQQYHDYFCRYNLERYQVNVIGTGEINEKVVKNKSGDDINLGVLKTVHNNLLKDTSPINVGFFIGRTDGHAHHLGMIGGTNSDPSSINEGKGIIQIQGRCAYSYSTLIGRTRILNNLDTLAGGDELNITYDINGLDSSKTNMVRHKVASCWPNPDDVPLSVDANHQVYDSYKDYYEQQKRADDLTTLYLKPKYSYDYENSGFINFPKDRDQRSLRNETKDYHHYDYNKFETQNGFRNGNRFNSKIYPECGLEQIPEDVVLKDKEGNEVDQKYAVKFKQGLGASTYSWYTCLPDNFNSPINDNYYQFFQGYNNSWNKHGLSYYNNSWKIRNYRSWQLYGHAPDAINHHNGFTSNDPEYGYYWTHLVRDFAVNNGLWLWATKDKSPVVYVGNTYDINIKLKYIATNNNKPLGTTCHPTNRANFKILYNHYNPDAVSYVTWKNLPDFKYYYHMSYMQNLMWYELNNPYNDSEKNTSYVTHSSNGYIIQDDLNQNLYNPKDHMIIDDGKVHYEKIKFSYEKQNNRGPVEILTVGDACEWFPCFAIGMGSKNEQGSSIQYSGDNKPRKYNVNGPQMGAYFNKLGSYQKKAERDRINKNPLTYGNKKRFISYGENLIWNNKYLFYNAGRFQSWDRLGNGQDGITGTFDSGANSEDLTKYNDEGFFNTQYTVDNDISLYILKAEATFTSKSGNEGDLVHHVDFLTGVDYVTYNDDKFEKWENDSEAKPKFNVKDVQKDKLITYAYGRTSSYGKVYGFYTDKDNPIYFNDKELTEEVGQYYAHSSVEPNKW